MLGEWLGPLPGRGSLPRMPGNRSRAACLSPARRIVLTTVMRKHQRYFGVREGGADGRLLPHFLAVANGPVSPDLVRAGNEAVLRARFEDARFFYRGDLRKPLVEHRYEALVTGLCIDISVRFITVHFLIDIAARDDCANSDFESPPTPQQGAGDHAPPSAAWHPFGPE